MKINIPKCQFLIYSYVNVFDNVFLKNQREEKEIFLTKILRTLLFQKNKRGSI